MDEEEEIRLQGAPVSEGIAIGTSFFLSSQEENIPEFPITMGEVDQEIARYRQALFSSREDLERLQNDLVNEGSMDAITIIDTHIQMLNDPLMTTHMEEKIRQMRQNTESVFRSVIDEYEKRFSQTKDSFFQQRLIDVMDLSKRILGHLCYKPKISFSDIPPNSVIFTKELVPSDTAAVQASRVRAFVTQKGVRNSHAALIARAKGIPYVACVDVHLFQNIKGRCVIVDGITGDVILNPTPATLEKYKEQKNKLRTHYKLLEKETHFKAETRDGYSVDVCANIGCLSDLGFLHQQGATGIGLFRTEFLFLEKSTFFHSEEEQHSAYFRIVESAKGLSVVIRVFDVGGDKIPDTFIGQPKEPNPVLGCRGIRFLLRHKDIFRIQLRAILRATTYGDVRILLPLVSDINELRETKQIINSVRQELLDEGLKVEKNVPLGCMIEVPSAALICNSLAQESDFLSIGTNDLVQYTLGVDRDNADMSDFYFPAHPSIIRMIKMIAIISRQHNKPVNVCGEMASNPLFIPLLIGLGINELSCAPRYIPVIKRIIRQCTLIDAYKVADHILTLDTTSEISKALLETYQHLTSEPF
jgi:phosphoenolpyruvate-protein phosphotransferase (PTS system enzyme I)